VATLSRARDKPFVSSAQNFEDVILWRALHGVEHGCYVDVGAFQPVVDSISWPFYEQGWNGVLVEPVPSLAAALRLRRPHDVVIEAAAGTERGSAMLYVAEAVGNSTLVRDVARRIGATGVSYSEIGVRVAPLDDLLEDAGVEGRTIHFCKIDVEGSERDVLAGFELRRWRPWILVIEATEPNRPRSSHQLWEHSVIEAGYRFCLFDGVNRFYVHSDKVDDFADKLSYPACIFDEAFVHVVSESQRAREFERLVAETSSRASELERVAAQASRRANELERENVVFVHRAGTTAAQLAGMRNSMSWRVTRPLRAVHSTLHRLAHYRRTQFRQRLGRDPPVRPGNVANQSGQGQPPRKPADADAHGSLSALDAGGTELSGWPHWADRLDPGSGRLLLEDGRRMRGQPRTNTPEQPLVTYITVVRNNASTLPRAIASVQEQTYDNVEHVVLDGASTDGTLDVLSQHADKLDYFASEEDRGLYDALNKAIPLARGDIVCVLNADDWLERDAAATAVSRLKAIKVPTLLLTAAVVRRNHRPDEPGTVEFVWYPALVHPGCYFSCADVCHNGIYATRGAYEKSGPYDPSYEIAGDFNWIMTCLDSGLSFDYARDLTINYVMGGLSSDPLQHAQECMRTMRRRFPSLTSEEAHGLYHCFFFLPPDPRVPDRPRDREEFLRRLLIRHFDDSELLRAIAWGVIHGETRHHTLMDTNAGAMSAFALTGDLATRTGSAHPALRRTAVRIRAGLRKR
jgi:FkbM family methyltransferase